MSDEQTIYIGPQDDLTNVRERLERIPARRVTLVIPSQTLLRSLIAWRNLYARAQELGKDVLIISSDPQVRSVAQGAKFKVASLESGPPGTKARPSGRILRPSSGGRGQNSPSSTIRVPPGGSGGQRESGSLRSRLPGQPPLREPRPAQAGPESRNIPGDGPVADEVTDIQMSAESPAEQHYGQPLYDYPFETPAPIRPLSPEHIEEEADDLSLDVRTSHDIVKAANEGSNNDVPTGPPQPSRAPAGPVPFTQEPSEPARDIPLSDESDPYDEMGESEPPLMGEQRGSVSLDGFDTTEQRIQEIPDFTTEKIQSGYGEEVQEDNHGPLIVDADSPGRSWMDVLAEEERGAEGPANPPRTYGVRSRSSSLPGNAPLQQRDEGRPRRPSIEEEPTHNIPPIPSEEPPPGPLRVRASAPSPTPAVPSSSSKNRSPQSGPVMGKSPAPARSQSKQEPPRTAGTKANSAGGAVNGAKKRTSPKDAAAQRRRVNSLVALVAIIIVLFLILGTLAYALPSATVTLTLASKAYTAPVSLSAKPQQAVAPGLVPATQLTHDFPVAVTASATGSKTAPGGPTATGVVTFTNTGTKPLDIPTGTVVTTANGVQFTTTFDEVVSPPNNPSNVPNHMDIPVQGSVNADSGAVTVIPPESLNAIVKSTNFVPGANVTLADAQHLQITNAHPITGGGTQSVHAIQQADLDAAKAAARTQEESAIAAWVKQSTHPGDVAGPAIVTNSTVLNPPAIGTAEENGTFPVTIKLTAAVLIVHQADLQAATVMTLNTALKKSKEYHGSYVVFNDPRQPLTLAPGTPKGDEKALLLNFTPTVKIIPNIAQEQVQHLLVGKSKADVESTLLALNPPKTVYVQKASVETWPSFINWLPFLAGRINVNFIAG